MAQHTGSPHLMLRFFANHSTSKPMPSGKEADSGGRPLQHRATLADAVMREVSWHCALDTERRLYKKPDREQVRKAVEIQGSRGMHSPPVCRGGPANVEAETRCCLCARIYRRPDNRHTASRARSLDRTRRPHRRPRV